MPLHDDHANVVDAEAAPRLGMNTRAVQYYLKVYPGVPVPAIFMSTKQCNATQ